MTATSQHPAPPRDRLAASPIYLVVTCPAAGADSMVRRAAAAARVLIERAGAVTVQWRCKQQSTDAVRALLVRARAALPAAAVHLVNDDLEAVFASDGSALADGVHLGREDAAALAPAGLAPTARLAAGLRAARERLGPDLLLGTSVRTRAELAAALAAGADHAGFGAIAPSGTKSDTQAADPAELRRLLEEFPHVPVFPIGGLSPANLGVVASAGAARAAIGAAVLKAPDPAAAALACLAALRAARL